MTTPVPLADVLAVIEAVDEDELELEEVEELELKPGSEELGGMGSPILLLDVSFVTRRSVVFIRKPTNSKVAIPVNEKFVLTDMA